jgi:hypothetical protein
MVVVMDSQFEELARVVAGTVQREIEPRFVAINKRFDDFQSPLTNIDSKLSGTEGRLTAHVDKQLDAAVTELKHQAQLHQEELKDDVKKVAEGYDATLKKIERELVDLNKNVDTGFHDRDLVLTDHSKQISELKKSR